MSSATISIDRKERAPERGAASSRGQDGARPSLRKELAVVAIVFIAASWVFFTGLGDFPLFNPDECFYAEPAREMLDTGDFITTTLNYAVRYTKPPLHYWATALCYYLFGADEFAARFFSAACGAVLVASTYCLVNKLVGMRAGLIATAILLSAPLYVVTGRLAIADMSLSLFIAGGLYCFFSAFREKRMSFAWIGYALFACAIMTKGPVGIVLPVLVLAAYHLLRRNLWQALAFYKPHWGALLVAVLALPWYIIETIVTKGEYFTCFIVMENFQRFTNVVSGHKQPWWYHIAAVGGGFLPWSIFLPQAFYGALRPVKSEGSIDISDLERSASPWNILDTYRNLTARQDLALFAVCFLVVTVAFYSASVSKLLSYTVPCFPALAMVVAIQIDRMLNDSKLKGLLVPMALLATVYGVGIFVEPIIIKLVRHAPPNIGNIVNGYMIAQFAGFATAVALAASGRRVWGVALMAVATLLSTSFFGYQIISAVSTKQERGLPAVARFAAASGEPMFVYKARLPSVPFYTHRPTVMSPAQEKPIAGTDRYTGVAGQSQPPKIKLFGFGEAPTGKFHHPVPVSPPEPAPAPAPKRAGAKPAYDRWNAADVAKEVSHHAKAYVICKSNDAPELENRQGFKRVTQAGSFVLFHWVKSGSEAAVKPTVGVDKSEI